MIVAFDLDGTLADICHRLHFIEKGPQTKPNWPAFYKACVHDKPIDCMIRVVEAMWLAGHTIEIWSGRSDEVKLETKDWLATHGVNYHLLRMRKQGDNRMDRVVKADWLLNLDPGERPVLAFDDRQQVVDMWREQGVKCCQVAPGDF